MLGADADLNLYCTSSFIWIVQITSCNHRLVEWYLDGLYTMVLINLFIFISGWVLIDRSGKHFGTILNYIRDGSVPLPETRKELEELAMEAKYFCVEGLCSACDEALGRLTSYEDLQNRATIVIVKCPNAANSYRPVTYVEYAAHSNTIQCGWLLSYISFMSWHIRKPTIKPFLTSVLLF
ncbi:unnamed protein product [Trichobilharzia regenti]|nr:unnamed protein product [Trichobilharzia regenti]